MNFLAAPLIVVLGLAMAGCTSQSNPEVVGSESAAAAVPEVDTEPLEVTVVSYLPENTIQGLYDNVEGFVGEGTCAIAAREAIENGNSVELSFDGEGSPLTAKMVPSPGNGDTLPCTIQAIFTNVPGSSATYTASVVGGAAAGLYAESRTVAELKSSGFQIDVVPEKVEAENVETILDVACLEGEIEFSIDKNAGYSNNEISVQNRVAFTNNCDKPIKAVVYDVQFSDAFGDLILNCQAKESIQIPVGESKKSAPERACNLTEYDSQYSDFIGTDKADISAALSVDKIAFKDGTTIEAS